jgi:hypothetical protein
MTQGSQGGTERCGACRYYLANKDSNPKDPTGLCRRYPPHAGGETDSTWPEVSDLDWCGEYAARS